MLGYAYYIWVLDRRSHRPNFKACTQEPEIMKAGLALIVPILMTIFPRSKILKQALPR